MSRFFIKMNVRQGLHLATSFPYKSMLVESINFFASREVAELRQVQEELLGANVNLIGICPWQVGRSTLAERYCHLVNLSVSS